MKGFEIMEHEIISMEIAGKVYDKSEFVIKNDIIHFKSSKSVIAAGSVDIIYNYKHLERLKDMESDYEGI